MLSRSVENQEHLMTESPREEEAADVSSSDTDGVREAGSSGPSETRVSSSNTVDDEVSVIRLPQITGAGYVTQTEQGDGLSRKGAGVSKHEAWSGKEKAAAKTETGNDKDSGSDPVPTSVVNIGFDL